MASPARFERTTCFLGGSRSIQLSYGDLTRIMMPVGPDNNPHMRPAVLNALSAVVLALAILPAPAAAETLLVRAGRLVDVDQGRVLRDQAVRIENGRIVSPDRGIAIDLRFVKPPH